MAANEMTCGGRDVSVSGRGRGSAYTRTGRTAQDRPNEEHRLQAACGGLLPDPSIVRKVDMRRERGEAGGGLTPALRNRRIGCLFACPAAEVFVCLVGGRRVVCLGGGRVRPPPSAAPAKCSPGQVVSLPATGASNDD